MYLLLLFYQFFFFFIKGDLSGSQGAKVTCARFGSMNGQIFASGDDKNFVHLYRLGSDKAILQLNTQNVSSTQVEVSAICFGTQDDEIYSGSNRGIINVWDIGTGKQSQTLKGHLASVNTLCNFPQQEQKNLLLSGAYDTLIKLWDLRQRSQVLQFKGHNNQINCLAVSPDAKLIASGSHDGTLKIWDISNSSRAVATFVQHDAPVTCLRYNPVDKALASGGNDRTVKYWDLDSFSLITSTRPDATPIQNILFESQGKYLFSAAHESLKVWNLERDGSLLDNVESSWRGVQDLWVTEEAPNGLLYGLACHQGFSLFCLSLGLVCFDVRNSQQERNSNSQKGNNVRKPTPDVTRLASQQQISPQKYQQNTNQIKSKPNFSNNARNILEQQQNQSPIIKQQSEQQPKPFYSLEQPPIQKIINIEQPFIQPQQQFGLLPQSFPKFPHIDVYSQERPTSSHSVNEILNNQNRYQPDLPVSKPTTEERMSVETPPEEIHNSELIMSNADLNFSSFINGEISREKFKQIDIIGEISREHLKVIQILKGRESYMKPIVHWWNAGNARSAVNAILQINEANILLDAMQMITYSGKISSLALELIPGLIEKSRILIESRYLSHIRGGLEFIQMVVNSFSEEIISVKGFITLSKMDIAREERIKKCDKVIEQLKVIVQSPKLTKIIERNREEVSEFTKQLQIQLLSLLKRVSQNQT